MKNSTKFVIIFWLSVFLISVLSVLYFTLTSAGVFGKMPSFEELENKKENLATKIWTEDGILLGTYFKENRSQISYNGLSKNLIDALVATEDVRFYSHSGIDFKALPRVISGMFGSLKGGGSTITQQLAKMLFPRKTNMNKVELVHRKFQEWVIAVKLEKNYTKEEIISMYLNKFDFLNLAVGIESAARVYFNTTPDTLNLNQAAMLVGMAKNPSLFNPLRREQQTLERRNVVLMQMVKYGYLEKEKYDSLKVLPLNIDYHPVDHNLGDATYFREFLRQWLTAKKPMRSNYIDVRDYVEDSINWHNDPSYGWFSKNTKPDGSYYDIYKDGLQIYTTINSRMQKYAEQAVAEHIGTYLQPAFFKDQKGRKQAPFSDMLVQKDVEKIMNASMRRCSRWADLKNSGLSDKEIEKTFYEPSEMSVFSWDGDTNIFKTVAKCFKYPAKIIHHDNKTTKGLIKKDIDVIMTPYDSILYYKHFLRTGMMSMEPESGYVKAFVGGIDYRFFKYDQVTKSRRQVGSTVKPYIYCLAMQNGLLPCTKVPNVAVSFKINKGKGEEIYTPKYSPLKGLDGEMISLKQGLANSLNQISAWILKQYACGIDNNYEGVQNVVDIAKSMGINSPIDAVPSICVGSAEVLISEMVASYCAFANQGMGVKPMYVAKITDKNGNTLQTFYAKKFMTKISEKDAYLMVELMRAVTSEGTASRLRYSYGLTADLAGKTGTTNENSDGWFMGMTPQLVSGVWVGGEERSIRFRFMDFGQGAVMALPIWGLYMKKVFNDKNLPYSQDVHFKEPANLSQDIINCHDADNNSKDYND